MGQLECFVLKALPEHHYALYLKGRACRTSSVGHDAAVRVDELGGRVLRVLLRRARLRLAKDMPERLPYMSPPQAILLPVTFADVCSDARVRIRNIFQDARDASDVKTSPGLAYHLFALNDSNWLCQEYFKYANITVTGVPVIQEPLP